MVFYGSDAQLFYDLNLSEKLLRELRTSLAMKLTESPDLLKISFMRVGERSIRAAASILWADRYADLARDRILTEQAREDIKQLTLKVAPSAQYYFEHRRIRPGASQAEIDLGKFVWTLRDRVELGEWLLYSWLYIISPLKHGGDPDRYNDPKKLQPREKPPLQMPVWTQVTEIVPAKPKATPPANVELVNVIKPKPLPSQDSIVQYFELAFQRSLGLTRQDNIKKLTDEERWTILEKGLAAPVTLPTRFEAKIPAVARQWYKAKKGGYANALELRTQVAKIFGIKE
jgi:hypothetical protein